MKRGSKNSTWKKNFYLAIFSELSHTTNLKKIRKKHGLSKQKLNYYLRQMKKQGLVINPSYGTWKPLKQSKNSTKYGFLLKKDNIRGHAYIINIISKKLPKNWNKRLKIIQEKGIHYKLVGAKQTTPRIKILGRKVWLCNNHIRIFDKKGESYYEINAIESRKQAFWTFYKIINILENKLGFNLRPFDFQWRKEHYALIKNDLAIQENNKGNIMRISDEEGEWLIIDDSLERGGELENVGKKALPENIKLSKWWNALKEDNFEFFPKDIKKCIYNQELEIKRLSKQNIQLTQVLTQMNNNLVRITKKIGENR